MDLNILKILPNGKTPPTLNLNKNLIFKNLYFRKMVAEIYYQKFLEKHLNGKHMKLSTGITDITTIDLHAEIKEWRCWRNAIAQILLYDRVERRDKLQLYFFGNYKEVKKKRVLKDLLKLDVFEIFELSIVDNNIIITSFKKDEIITEVEAINDINNEIEIIKDEIIDDVEFIIKKEEIIVKEPAKIIKREPYNCVRCNYTTNHKGHMKFHLYDLKCPCPGSKNVIELTDEIKEFILANRFYNVPLPTPPAPPTPPTPITQIINNNNTINNFIANMDSVEKLTKYITFKDTTLLEYPETIKNKFSKIVTELENGTSNFLVLDKHNLLEVINQVTSLVIDETFENFNIIYDEKFNRLKLYESGKWTDSLLMTGIRTLLMQIQAVYFDVYECYLIRKIEYSQLVPQHKTKIREQLAEYYKFLGCFEIEPYVVGRNDSEIKYNMDDERRDPYLEFTDENRAIPILYSKMYSEIRDKTLVSQLKRIKIDIIDIIKKNSKRNLDELNKKMFSLFNMDEEFKQSILTAR
jgi:hypothetical protein